MRIAYHLDSAMGCTFIVWDREVTPDEWRDHHERMFGDPDFPAGVAPRATPRFDGNRQRYNPLS